MTDQPKSSARDSKILQKLEERRETYKDHGKLYRLGFALLGTLILLAGLVMLVTPGPAFVLIPIGLAILSLEFAWAETLLDKALDQADKAAQKARETTLKQRILTGFAGVLVAAAVVAAIFYWDITVPILNPAEN